MRRSPLWLVIALSVLLAVPPASSFPTMARTFYDVAVDVDLDRGAGLYDPTTSSYCLAFIESWTGVLPVGAYYAGLRYFPAATRGTAIQAQLPALREPTDCAGLVPNDQVVLDQGAAAAGAAVWSQNFVDYREPPIIPETRIDLQYCSQPHAVQGLAGFPGPPLPPLPVAAFTGAYAECAVGWQTYNLYPGCPGFNVVFETGGALNGDRPIFLEDLPDTCNSLRGAPPAGDFVVQHCLKVVYPDRVEYDSDFFVVGRDGSLLAWALAQQSPFDALFPNVSNLEENRPAPSCPA